MHKNMEHLKMERKKVKINFHLKAKVWLSGLLPRAMKNCLVYLTSKQEWARKVCSPKCGL